MSVTGVKRASSSWVSLKIVAQSCPTLCDPMDGSPPGSSVHGILQAKILEWVAIPFSRGSSQPRDRTWVSCITVRFFTLWDTREAPSLKTGLAQWEQGSRALFRNKRARLIGFRVFLCLLSKQEFYFGLKINISQDCFLMLLLLKHNSYFTNYSQTSSSWRKAEWVEGRDRHWREINALELKSPGTFTTWLFPWDFIRVLYSLPCKS